MGCLLCVFWRKLITLWTEVKYANKGVSITTHRIRTPSGPQLLVQLDQFSHSPSWQSRGHGIWHALLRSERSRRVTSYHRSASKKARHVSWRHEGTSKVNDFSTLPRKLVPHIWGFWRQKQVSQAWLNNCIPQNTVVCNYLSMAELPVSGAKILLCVRPLCWCSINGSLNVNNFSHLGITR